MRCLHQTLPSRLKDICRRVDRKMLREEVMGDYKEPVFSRYSNIDADMDSQRVWQDVQDQYMFEPDGAIPLGVKSGHRVRPLTKVDAVDFHWQRENRFSPMELRWYKLQFFFFFYFLNIS